MPLVSRPFAVEAATLRHDRGRTAVLRDEVRRRRTHASLRRDPRAPARGLPRQRHGRVEDGRIERRRTRLPDRVLPASDALLSAPGLRGLAVPRVLDGARAYTEEGARSHRRHLGRRRASTSTTSSSRRRNSRRRACRTSPASTKPGKSSTYLKPRLPPRLVASSAARAPNRAAPHRALRRRARHAWPEAHVADRDPSLPAPRPPRGALPCAECWKANPVA